ncbi:aromatic amino acid lyase [Nocardia sp. NPDC051911]|uniref:aromatic amino acid lyase n=1 Tax=Nocardia sp. NPDC051911 TaxID=3154648 RepID=UPI00342BC512
MTRNILNRSAEHIQVAVVDQTLKRVGVRHAFLFGPLVAFSSNEDAADQCDTVFHHSPASKGAELAPRVVRTTVLACSRSLARGHSVISAAVSPALVAVLGMEYAPTMAGVRMPAGETLRTAGLAPFILDGLDALTFVNGTSLTAAAAGLAVTSALRSHIVAMISTALLADLLGSDPILLSDESQEPYGKRCTSQSLGATHWSSRNGARWSMGEIPSANRNLMLATRPGKQDGVQGVRPATAAIVAAMCRAAAPASMRSLPTNGHAGDVVPSGTQAALNALDLAESLRWLHGSLAVGLRQAVHVGGREPTSPASATILHRLIALVPAIDPERQLEVDVRCAADLLDTIADEHDDPVDAR